MIVYIDTRLPEGPFGTSLNGSDEAVVLHVDDGSFYGETGEIDDPADWEGETITFESRDVFQEWARRVAACAGLRVIE